MCLEYLSPSSAKPNKEAYIGVRDKSLITGYYVYNKNNEYLPQVGTMKKLRNICSVEVLQLNEFVPNLEKKKKKKILLDFKVMDKTVCTCTTLC